MRDNTRSNLLIALIMVFVVLFVIWMIVIFEMLNCINCDPTDMSMQSNSSLIVKPISYNQINIMSEALPASESDSDTVRLTSNVPFVEPYDWSINFVDPTSEWATGKSVTDYVTITVVESDLHIVDVNCSQPFKEQIIIRLSSRLNSNVTATCTVDYKQKYHYARVQFVIYSRYGIAFDTRSETAELNYTKENLSIRAQLNASISISADSVYTMPIETAPSNVTMLFRPTETFVSFLGNYLAGKGIASDDGTISPLYNFTELVWRDFAGCRFISNGAYDPASNPYSKYRLYYCRNSSTKKLAAYEFLGALFPAFNHTEYSSVQDKYIGTLDNVEGAYNLLLESFYAFVQDTSIPDNDKYQFEIIVGLKIDGQVYSTIHKIRAIQRG